MSITESIMENLIREMGIVAESVVLLDNKSGAQVIIHPDSGRNFGDEAYFKFIPDKSVDLKHSARISFTKPEYIYHYTNQYTLYKNDKKALMRMLTSASTKDKSISGWVALIREFNRFIENDHKSSGRVKLLPEDLEMPDYTKLK